MRLREHFNEQRLFDAFAVIEAPTWLAEQLEFAYIRWLRPLYNITHNVADDYPEFDDVDSLQIANFGPL